MSGDPATASKDAFFLRLHELTQRFLEKRPQWVDLNNDTGGAGLCEFGVRTRTPYPGLDDWPEGR